MPSSTCPPTSRTLTAAVCDIESVSQDEAALADAIEAALRPLAAPRGDPRRQHGHRAHSLGRAERVVLAGHIDTVPLTSVPNLPTRRVDGELLGPWHGRHEGRRRPSCCASPPRSPSRAVTSPSSSTSARRSTRASTGSPASPTPRPSCVDGDFAVLLEPTNGAIEGGCKGTLRVEVVTQGVAAHSARPWKGHNAIHDARRRADAPGGLRGRDHHRRRARLPRGAAGRRHQRRHRRQRHPRPVHRHGQLPLRARQGHRGRPSPTCARSSTAST